MVEARCVCGQLLFKGECVSEASIEIKCRRCKSLQTFVFTHKKEGIRTLVRMQLGVIDSITLIHN